MADDTFYIKAGDTLPPLSATLEDGNGVAVSLTGATVVLHLSRRWTKASVTLAGVASVVSAAAGTVQYAWAAADTAAAGAYLAEWQATWPTSPPTTLTFPNDGGFVVIISPQLA